MKRGRFSDSKTHAEKSNWTSRTDMSQNSLCYIFLGHPVWEIKNLNRIFMKFSVFNQKCMGDKKPQQNFKKIVFNQKCNGGQKTAKKMLGK